jgi:hypothetical protein
MESLWWLPLTTQHRLKSMMPDASWKRAKAAF